MQAFLPSIFLASLIACQIAFAVNSNEEQLSNEDSVHGISKRTSYTSYTYQYRNRARQCPKPGAPKNGFTWYNSRTVGSVAVHSCKRGFALDGPRLRTCKSNGQWSKELPECVGVDCGDPGEPDNSIRVLSSTTLNSIAKYKCKEGFRMAGSSYRVCQANGEWTGVPVRCIGTSCSSLSNPLNGAVDVPSREIGSTATYSCNTGFSLAGSQTRVCKSGGSWSGAAPTCQAIDCGNLLNPQNGQVSFTSTTFGSTAAYTCNDGFTLVGSNSRQCQQNGRWSRQAPICRVLSCGRLESPTNGKVVLSGTTPGSQATYSCNDGFQLRGNVQRNCQNNGQWSGRAPSCSAVICEPLVAPLNGFVTFSSTSAQRPGDKATYSCREGFILNGGDRVRVCQQDMTYTGSAPRCRAITCGSLRDPANGRVNVGSGNVGSQAVYSCNRGFRLEGNARRTCQSSGTYDGNEPSCRPINCGRLPAPANGRIVITTTLFGGAAKYFCNDGFELTGFQIRRCSANGQWSNNAPSCRSVGCGQLQSPGNGLVQLTGTTIGSLATYSCNDGFLLVGNSRRTCQRSSQWSGDMPSCQRVSCQVLQPPQFGSVSVSGSTPGARATYTCNRGALLVGLVSRICQDDGSYSGQAPVCQLITCEQLVSPTNGQVAVSGDNRPGSVARYSCNQGFNLMEGSAERTCGNDGSYSGQAPVCREIGCGELSNPANGGVQFSSSLVSSIATYSCNNGYNLVGVSQRICQPSGEWSGSEPRCDLVDCGVLPEPSFGTVIFSSTAFLSRATYSCNDGFQLSEFVTRVCQANGQWSGSAPTCQSITCERLTNQANGFVVVRGNTIGAIATYSCNPGFKLNGQETRQCQSNGRYSGQAPQCNAVNCGILQNPQNGFVNFRTTSVGATASYTCNQGFTVTGSIVRVCQPNGEWSGQEPTCSSIDCGPLVAPGNGFVNVPSTNFGSTASYQCNNGFILSGDRTRVCQRSGSWSGSDPVCQGVTCDPLDAPNNGFIRFSSTTVGSVASYSCNPGFELQGVASRICRPGGEWSEVAPVCIAISCGPLNSPARGSVDISGTNTNAIAAYSCDAGFNLIGKSTRVCTSTGVWSGVAPTCQASDCGSLDNPSNGYVDISGTSFSDTATYRCNIGYQLVGEPVRTCQETGVWSGTVPFCAPVDCGILETPKNSRISITGTIINSIATYSCFPGYELVGAESRLCSPNGQWAGQAPFCKPTECESLISPVNGHVSFTDVVVYSVATYECDRGFGIKGAVTRMCQKDSTWSGSEPTCEPSDCGPLFSPTNGMVDTTGTEYGDTATYTCMPGFTIIGEATRTCDTSGVWTGVAPICQSIDCGNLNSPSSGRVTFTSSTFRAVAEYTCNFGFQLIGEMTRVCQAEGSWSGESPICQKITCSNLISPSNGRLELSNGNLVGSVASYFCFSGFALDGNQQRTCQQNMEWTGFDPICRSQSCGPLNDPLYGEVSFASSTINSIATYTCNSGFQIVGATNRVCLEQGVWSNDAPICEAILCPPLNDPQFGSVSISGNTIGSVATYSCNANFVLSDSTPRRCLSDGSWSGTSPICRAIECGELAQPANGAVRVSGTRFGESARYSCTFGFILQGNEIRVCQIDGSWSGNVPVCIESLCPTLPNPTNGDVMLPTTRTVGSIATYSCNTGFELVGVNSRICRDNEEWTGEDPFCEARSCGQLFNPVNGQVQFSSTTVGSVARYTCNPGFNLVGGESRTCQNNRIWSGQEPRCNRVVIECPPLQPPVNGDVGLSGNTPGSTASYTCSTGFILVGNDNRFCQSDETWSGSDPTCRSVNCPPLIAPRNGNIRFIGSGFGALVRYTCIAGFSLIGDSSRTCKSDGLWSGSDPICIPDATPTSVTSCGDPGTPPNSQKIGNSYNIGDVVHYECITGYMMSGGSSLTCNTDGRWVGTLPTCTKSEEECFGGGRVFDSCGRACRCDNGKFVDCCRFRRDFASFSDKEKEDFIDAILTLSSDPTFSARYNALLEDYKASFNTDAYSSDYKKGQFFMWNRYFLLEYENLLQEINCRITIPFYDWTVLPLQPYNSVVWNDDYGFGKTSSDTDYCMLSGPFDKDDYSLIPSAGGSCLKREYKKQKFPTRSLIERDVLTQPASNFNQFYRYMQLYIHTTVRCFVGGTMCTEDAANDPVFILHLAMIDHTYDRWQRFSEDRLRVRYSSDDSQLVLAPNYAVRDFYDNSNLPGNTAVCYNEPNYKSHLPHALSGFSAQASFDPGRNIMGCLSNDNLNEVDHHRLTENEKQYIRSKCVQ